MSIIETPLQLQHLALKNRIIRSAVHSFLAGEDGYMTAAEYNMYEVLAKNGIGTIITGHCCVDPLGRANPEQVNIYEDCFTDQFRKAVAIAHAHDVRFIPQINHAGPRAIDNEDLVAVVKKSSEGKVYSLRAAYCNDYLRVGRILHAVLFLDSL